MKLAFYAVGNDLGYERHTFDDFYDQYESLHATRF